MTFSRGVSLAAPPDDSIPDLLESGFGATAHSLKNASTAFLQKLPATASTASPVRIPSLLGPVQNAGVAIVMGAHSTSSDFTDHDGGYRAASESSAAPQGNGALAANTLSPSQKLGLVVPAAPRNSAISAGQGPPRKRRNISVNTTRMPLSNGATPASRSKELSNGSGDPGKADDGDESQPPADSAGGLRSMLLTDSNSFDITSTFDDIPVVEGGFEGTIERGVSDDTPTPRTRDLMTMRLDTWN